MGEAPPRTGVLLVNVGTPDGPSPPEVRRYLREFLGDPRVVDLPAPGRWLLLNLIILPFRPRKSAHAYGKIWTPQGSPLLIHSRRMTEGLAAAMPDAQVALAMRYGNPRLEKALDALASADLARIVVAPMFPHHASATTGTVLEAVYDQLARMPRVPPVSVLPPFYDAPPFLDAVATVFEESMEGFAYEHVLLSYHGVPLRQVQRTVSPGHTCAGIDAAATCCDTFHAGNRHCYRAQAMVTSRGLASRIGGVPVTTSFQSRLGRAQWLGPSTESEIARLARSGVKRLAVACPSFVVDCLETLEEIAIRGAEIFKANGGEDMRVVPCVNEHPAWIAGLAEMVRAVV